MDDGSNNNRSGQGNGRNGGSGPQNAETREMVLKIAGEMERRRLTGVGGWLILFIVLYTISMLGLAYTLLLDFSEPDPYQTMLQYGGHMLEKPSPLWTLADIVKAGLILAVFVCMFSRRKITPRLCQLLVGLELVVGNLYMFMDPDRILEEMFMRLDPQILVLGYLVCSVAYALAWIVYFNKSKRVRYTFIN